MKKTYLGDSVYVEEGYMGVVLTTDNGHGPNNTIILEPEVIVALEKFLEQLVKEIESA